MKRLTVGQVNTPVMSCIYLGIFMHALTGYGREMFASLAKAAAGTQVIESPLVDGSSTAGRSITVQILECIHIGLVKRCHEPEHNTVSVYQQTSTRAWISHAH